MHASGGTMISSQVDHAHHCTECNHQWYYTKPICPSCEQNTIETYELDVGVVESTTIVHTTPQGVRSPNRLALARFEGIGVIAQVADTADALVAGDSVRFAGEYVLRETASEMITGPRLIATQVR